MTDLEKAKIAAWDELIQGFNDNYYSGVGIGLVAQLLQKHMPPPKLEPVELDVSILSAMIDYKMQVPGSLTKALALLAAQIERDILKKLEAK